MGYWDNAAFGAIPAQTANTPPSLWDDQAFGGAMQPETYANPMVHNLMAGLLSLPQRAIQNSQYSLDTGNYDPKPTLEAATLPMIGGFGGVPTRAGETVLGAGMIPGSGPEAKAAWSALRKQTVEGRDALAKIENAMRSPAPEHVDPFAGMNESETAAEFERLLRNDK
jgi:hypothetical protein